MPKRDFLFADLVHSGKWQSVQDSLSEALGLSLRTLSPNGNPLTRPSQLNFLCHGLLHDMNDNPSLCNLCKDVSTVKPFIKTSNFKGSFGLNLYVIPIRAVGDLAVAYVYIGPVILKTRRSPSEYAKEAISLGIDPDELQNAMIDINVFSYSRMDSIVKLVDEIFSYIAQTGYQKKRLGEIAPEIAELDPLFSAHYEERILSNLLNCCSVALNADSGSVMIVDKKTNKLHIKVAEKLDQAIINSTEIAMGEGIAGLAASKSESFILPNDQNKNHLLGKMKRSYIKSSLIVPFNKGNENDVYGVINLNIMKKEVGFTDREVALVKEMVSMASVALIPVHA